MTTDSDASTPPQRPTFSLEDLSRFVPGLGTLMPEIGTRTWKLYYAAQAGNWAMARFQLGELRGLMLRGAVTRPRYEADLKGYVEQVLSRLSANIEGEDFAGFAVAFDNAIRTANEYHDATGRDYIVWKLPDFPPPDLDLAPRS